jgi:outer membrane protein OmpA-like peptidoglycan-associated protein
MNKNVPILTTNIFRASSIALVFVSLSVLMSGCPEQKPVAAKPDVSQPTASASTAPTTPAPQSAATPAPTPAAAPAPVAAASATPASAPPPPPPILSFDDAVANAAHAVFNKAPTPDPNGAVVVIDPLVDGMSGYQSNATQTIQEHITRIIKADFPQYRVQPITPKDLKQHPRILVGTFTPVNAEMKTAGVREAYRFCLVMGDLATGKIIAKSVARARLADVDSTPTVVFSDSPVWVPDPSIQAYIATCQASKVGDPIKPEYLEGLQAASLVSEANDAYTEKHYAEALDLYNTALKAPAGEQLRVYDGRYMSLAKLGRSEQTAAFRDLVDYGFHKNRLAVKFLFRPGSVRFATTDNSNSSNYGMWLEQIALQASASKSCLEIRGHTSPTGPAALNDTLSLTRAEYIQSRLEEAQPSLKKRTVAAGVGSRENLVGTGRDDSSDELDRRVDFKSIEACP